MGLSICFLLTPSLQTFSNNTWKTYEQDFEGVGGVFRERGDGSRVAVLSLPSPALSPPDGSVLCLKVSWAPEQRPSVPFEWWTALLLWWEGGTSPQINAHVHMNTQLCLCFSGHWEGPWHPHTGCPRNSGLVESPSPQRGAEGASSAERAESGLLRLCPRLRGELKETRGSFLWWPYPWGKQRKEKKNKPKLNPRHSAFFPFQTLARMYTNSLCFY